MSSLLATRGALGALLLTTALAAAACGGSSGSASTTTAATTSTTTTAAATAGAAATSAAMAKYSACLKQNGVTLPTGGGAPPGGAGGAPPTGTTGARPTRPKGGNAAFAKAQAACAKLRPAGLRAGGFGGRGGGGGNTAAFAAYRNCLTLHGVKASALQRGGAKPTAAVTKAMTACAGLRPKVGAPTAGATTTTGGNS
jgi:hypothetical protein